MKAQAWPEQDVYDGPGCAWPAGGVKQVPWLAIQKSISNKCWRGCGEKGTLLHCWWECKLVQPLWRTVWRFLQFSSVSHVQLFETPWTVAYQASLSFIISWSLLKLMSIELVMPSNHLILCGALLLLPSVLPSIRVFSSESALHIRWPKA